MFMFLIPMGCLTFRVKKLKFRKVFGEKTKWTSDDALVDLSKATSIAIDGDIWVLIDGGSIYKFTRGNSQKFSLASDFLTDFSPDFLFTGDGIGNLYFLDKEKGEI